MFFVIDIKILYLTKMDTLPYEIVDHIASYLNKNDLVNFATANSEYNNILSKRVAYEKEKYNFDRYINHNRMVTLMYIRDRDRQYYMRKYYKRCIICGREYLDLKMMKMMKMKMMKMKMTKMMKNK
jgi:hypothetical protein